MGGGATRDDHMLVGAGLLKLLGEETVLVQSILVQVCAQIVYVIQEKPRARVSFIRPGITTIGAWNLRKQAVSSSAF